MCVGKVRNIGGGRPNSVSILETFEPIAAITGRRKRYEYVEQNRAGDRIYYIGNLSKMKAHYSKWNLTESLDDILSEIVRSANGFC